MIQPEQCMVWPEPHRLEQLSGRSRLHNNCDVPHMPAKLAREPVQGRNHQLFKAERHRLLLLSVSLSLLSLRLCISLARRLAVPVSQGNRRAAALSTSHTSRPCVGLTTCEG